jgi:hypothetical protein
MSEQQVLAVVRLALVVATVLVIYRNRCMPKNLAYSAPYLLYLGHALLYLIVYLILSYTGRVNAMFFNIWSGSLQVHILLTILIVESFRTQRHNKRGLDGC